MIDFPNAPTVGQVVSSPSGTAWRWNGTTWLLGTGASAGGARGTVAYAQVTANQSPVTTEATIAGLTATITAVAGRSYRITGSTRCYSTISTDRLILRIKEGATALQTVDLAPVGTGNPNLFGQVVVTPTAGPHTYLLSIERQGTGTASTVASATSPAFILVEDITFEQPSTGGGGGGGSGYTFVSDTKPTAANIGDTWFNSSTGASGGVSYVAIEEAPGGEKVWVQTSPGAGAAPTAIGGLYTRTTSVSIPTTAPTTVPFDNLSFAAGITASNSHFTILTAGMYIITYAVTWATSTVGLRNQFVTLNDSTSDRFIATTGVPGAVGECALSGSGVASLPAGTAVSLVAYQTSGGGLNIAGGGSMMTSFSIAKVG